MEIEDGPYFRHGRRRVNYRLQFRRYGLPFRVAVRTAHGRWAKREGLLVRLESEQGRTGWGEAAPLPWFGTETVEQAESACRAMGAEIEEGRLGAPAGMRCLNAALAAARLDLEGGAGLKAGGNPDRDNYPVAALLPAGRPALAHLRRSAEADFRTFKWKVGAGDPGDEMALLDDVCAALPAGGRLRLDANGAWDRRGAERWLALCADRPVEFVEQPVAPDASGAEDLLRGLARDYPTPLALDESLAADRDIERWLELGWSGVFVVKPSLLEDPAASLGRLAAAGAAVVFSSALETGVGARSALRTAFAWQGQRLALGFGVWPLFVDPIFDGPAAKPFFRHSDLNIIDPEVLWNALS
jgi:O-succinylbenzoate synthase